MKMTIESCVRDVQHAEEQAYAWFGALKTMLHDFIVANGSRRGGDFITVGELSTNVLRSGDAASRWALNAMLRRFTWITCECPVWDLSRAILNYPEQAQAALIKAAKEVA